MEGYDVVQKIEAVGSGDPLLYKLCLRKKSVKTVVFIHGNGLLKHGPNGSRMLVIDLASIFLGSWSERLPVSSHSSHGLADKKKALSQPVCDSCV